MRTTHDEPRNVRDIGMKECANIITNCAEFLPVDCAGIRGVPRNDHLRLYLFRLLPDEIVIEHFCFWIEFVRRGVVRFSGEVHLPPMRQVPSMGQCKPHDGIAVFEHGMVDRHVRWAAGIRLHIEVIHTEEFLPALDREHVLPDLAQTTQGNYA